MIFKALIVDDESAAREYLSSLITEYCPDLKVVGKASSSIEAIKLLKENEVDILFLDIEMPGGTGFDLLDAIDTTDYKIVFTTAYEKFALSAFKVRADGYLLKPIDIDELEDLIKSFKKTIIPKVDKDERITLKTQDSIHFLKHDQIVHVKGEGNYTTFFLNDGRKIVISKNLKQTEEMMCHPVFLKTHKSHIININYITRFVKIDGGHFEMTDGSEIPVSRRRKEEILSFLATNGF